jgi:hypothetical protein
MTSKKKDSDTPDEPKLTPSGAPDITGHKVVDGEHDLSNHPAVESGAILGVGEGERTTTTKDPAKKTGASRSAKRGDGSGPED